MLFSFFLLKTARHPHVNTQQPPIQPDSLPVGPVGLMSSSSDEHTNAADGCYATVPFIAAYFDGCGGAPRPLIQMIESLFDERRVSALAGSVSRDGTVVDLNPPRIAVGFTLTAAEPTGASLPDREQAVTRALVAAARRVAYSSVLRVGDEPERYGVDPETPKNKGGTLTTWLMCERGAPV